jgi:hypothetical protein
MKDIISIEPCKMIPDNMSRTIARRSGRAGKHRQHWNLAEDRMGRDDRRDGDPAAGAGR